MCTVGSYSARCWRLVIRWSSDNVIMSSCDLLQAMRLYATQHLRVLLRAKMQFFNNWGIQMLVTQVTYDVIVCYVSCDLNSYMMSMRRLPWKQWTYLMRLVKRRCGCDHVWVWSSGFSPIVLSNSIDHSSTSIVTSCWEGCVIVDKVSVMSCDVKWCHHIIRFISTSRGFTLMKELGYLDNELLRWFTSYNEVYVQLVEQRLAEAFTSYRCAQESSYVRRSATKWVLLCYDGLVEWWVLINMGCLLLQQFINSVPLDSACISFKL